MSEQQPETDVDEVDQDSEATNQAPPGERPTDPEQNPEAQASTEAAEE